MLLHGKVLELYRQKEIEFPVTAGMARFMSERSSHGAGRAEATTAKGCSTGRSMRFPQAAEQITRGRLPHRVARQAAGDAARRQPRRATRPRPSRSIDDQARRGLRGHQAVRAGGRPASSPNGRSTNSTSDVPEAALTGVDRRRRASVCGTPSTRAIAPRCGRWSAACCSTSSTRRGRTISTRWTTAFRHRPVRLRPGRSEDGVQAGGHEGIRQHVGRRRGQGDGDASSAWRRRGLPGVDVGDRRDDRTRRRRRCHGRRRDAGAHRRTAASETRRPSRSATAARRSAATIRARAAAARSTRTATCGRRCNSP